MQQNILAIECSLPQASLCLYQGGKLCSSHQWRAERNHDSYLFPALEQALEALQGEPLELILVGSGPGSYGGVRVALAAAQGLALVLHCPVAALCSWEGLAHGEKHIISDAKRGGWTHRSPDGAIQVISLEQVGQLCKAGTDLASVESQELLAQHGIELSETGLTPQAESLIQTWLSYNENKKNHILSQEPEPIYVRAPHITQAKRKPWESARK